MTEPIPELDLAFALSASALNADNTFTLLKDAVTSVVDKYGKDKVKYAVIVFGANAETRLNFGDLSVDLDGLKNHIDNIKRPVGQPNLQRALVEADLVFKRERPRENVRRVLVVAMDKNSVNRQVFHYLVFILYRVTFCSNPF